MHVNHARLLAKLAKRVAVGKNLNKHALAKAGRNETWLDKYLPLDEEPAQFGRPLSTAHPTGAPSAWSYAEDCYDNEVNVWDQCASTS
jgi:hypothetical protein